MITIKAFDKFSNGSLWLLYVLCGQIQNETIGRYLIVTDDAAQPAGLARVHRNVYATLLMNGVPRPNLQTFVPAICVAERLLGQL